MKARRKAPKTAKDEAPQTEVTGESTALSCLDAAAESLRAARRSLAGVKDLEADDSDQAHLLGEETADVYLRVRSLRDRLAVDVDEPDDTTDRPPRHGQ